MIEPVQSNTVVWMQISRLISKVPSAEFGADVLAVLSSVARLENFGAYHISDLARPAPVLSFWSGRISDYWFRRDADILLGTPETQSRILKQIESAPNGGVHIERWYPGSNDKRAEIYRRNGICERLAVSSKDGRSGLRSFYLRSETDGCLSDAEYADLCGVLPIVHGLIGLRHQIVGTAAHQVGAGAEASRLRDCNVPGFCDLSRREAQVCDLSVEGKSVAASALELSVSETTIKTMRARAYRKLGIHSATELMSLFIKSQRAVQH